MSAHNERITLSLYSQMASPGVALVLYC